MLPRFFLSIGTSVHTSSASAWLLVVICLALASAVLSLPVKPLPTIHEDRPFLDYRQEIVPATPPDATPRVSPDSSPLRYTPAENRDLYPATSAPQYTTSVYTRPTFQRLQRIPITGLVRGQKGKLVPYRLKGSNTVNIFADIYVPSRVISSSRGWSPWRQVKTLRPGASPSNNVQMAQLLQSHPTLAASAFYDKKAMSDPSAIGKKYQAVQLQGKGLDLQTLDHMTKTKKSFYVLGAKGKIWYFHTDDGVTFTYTDSLTREEKRLIAGLFPTSEMSRSQSVIQAMETIHTGTGFAASPYPERNIAKSQRKYGLAWLRKLAEGTKDFLQRPAVVTRNMHGIQ